MNFDVSHRVVLAKESYTSRVWIYRIWGDPIRSEVLAPVTWGWVHTSGEPLS